MLPDVQTSPSDIQVPIYRVGISNLTLPVYISTKEGGQQHTVANIDIFVDLEAHRKGTHMSRLSIAAQKFIDDKLSQYTLRNIADYIIDKCEAQTCQLIYKFTYFTKKEAPITNKVGYLNHNVIFDLTATKDGNESFKMTVDNNITSLCPCSKELASSYDNQDIFNEIGGAHNQKNVITVTCETSDFVWIEDIIDTTDKCGSCQIYSVLKREDEQEVTLRAYNNPMFCEDIVRAAYAELSTLKNLKWFEVTSSSQESIHQHFATAKINSELIKK